MLETMYLWAVYETMVKVAVLFHTALQYDFVSWLLRRPSDSNASSFVRLSVPSCHYPFLILVCVFNNCLCVRMLLALPW